MLLNIKKERNLSDKNPKAKTSITSCIGLQLYPKKIRQWSKNLLLKQLASKVFKSPYILILKVKNLPC